MVQHADLGQPQRCQQVNGPWRWYARTDTSTSQSVVLLVEPSGPTKKLGKGEKIGGPRRLVPCKLSGFAHPQKTLAGRREPSVAQEPVGARLFPPDERAKRAQGV